MLSSPGRCRKYVLASALLLLGLPLLLGGCSTYSTGALKIRQQVTAGQEPAALAELQKNGGDDPDVLSLMEQAILLYYQDQYEKSNELLQRADQKIEDQYTKSVSKEALAFLTNDATLPYNGYPHEQVMIHIYGALNYLALGDRESALVECRRVALRLQMMESHRDDKKGYTDDAFAQWLSGILYAEDGDGNSTMVSARRAYAAYQEAGSLWGQPMPTDFLMDYHHWAQQFVFPEEVVELQEKHSFLAEADHSRGFETGEVLLIYEAGFVDHLEEERISFPILEEDTGNMAEDGFAERVYVRGRRGYYKPRKEVKIKYWLEVAMPFMVPTPPLLNQAVLVAGERKVATAKVHDLSAIARLTYDEGQAKRMVRTIARAIVKYAATASVKKDNQVLGFLTNAITALSERADTRSWTLLPDNIQLARMEMPAGSYPMTVEVLDSAGRVARTASFESVEILPGELTVIHHRSYR